MTIYHDPKLFQHADRDQPRFSRPIHISFALKVALDRLTNQAIAENLRVGDYGTADAIRKQANLSWADVVGIKEAA